MPEQRPSDALRPFAANLRAIRLARGFTQQTLARAAAMTSGEVSRMERSVREPRLLAVARLADALGVEASVLLSSSREGVALTRAQAKPIRRLIDDLLSSTDLHSIYRSYDGERAAMDHMRALHDDLSRGMVDERGMLPVDELTPAQLADLVPWLQYAAVEAVRRHVERSIAASFTLGELLAQLGPLGADEVRR